MSFLEQPPPGSLKIGGIRADHDTVSLEMTLSLLKGLLRSLQKWMSTSLCWNDTSILFISIVSSPQKRLSFLLPTYIHPLSTFWRGAWLWGGGGDTQLLLFLHGCIYCRNQLHNLESFSINFLSYSQIHLHHSPSFHHRLSIWTLVLLFFLEFHICSLIMLPAVFSIVVFYLSWNLCLKQ